MSIPAQGYVSESQALTATNLSTTSVDFGAQTPDDFAGLGFALAIGTAADIVTGNETYVAQIVTSAASDLSTPTILASFTMPGARLFAGAAVFLPFPVGVPSSFKRYQGLKYVLGGTTPAVTVTSWLTSRSVFEMLIKRADRVFVD